MNDDDVAGLKAHIAGEVRNGLLPFTGFVKNDEATRYKIKQAVLKALDGLPLSSEPTIKMEGGILTVDLPLYSDDYWRRHRFGYPDFPGQDPIIHKAIELHSTYPIKAPMTKPNLPKDTPAGTKILVDGFPGVFLGHVGDLPIWHWSETDKLASTQPRCYLGAFQDEATKLGFDLSKCEFADNRDAKTMEVVVEGKYNPHNLKVGSKISIDGRNAVVVGVAKDRIVTAYTSGSFFTNNNACSISGYEEFKGNIESLGFDPTKRYFNGMSLVYPGIEVLGEEPSAVEEPISTEKTGTNGKRCLTKDSKPGTIVMVKSRKATLVLIRDGDAFIRFAEPGKPGDGRLTSSIDDKFARAAKALGFDPQEMAYGYVHLNASIEILEYPKPSTAGTTTSTETTAMSEPNKRYLSADTKIGSRLIIGGRPAIFLGCITGYTTHGQVFFTDDKDDGCHIVADVYAKWISDLGLDPKAAKVRDIELKNNTVEIVEEKPATKASTYLMIGGALLGSAIAAFCKATEAPSARVEEVEDEISDEDILSIEDIETSKEAVA